MFSFAVLPVREPPVQGTLITLDELVWTPAPTYELEADAEVTVRLLMNSSTGTFKWTLPTEEQTCVKVVNENFGDFSTGFEQWLIQAKNLPEDCSQDIVLTHTDDSVNSDTIKITVKKGHCAYAECPAGEIQNIDITSANACACEPLVHEGFLIDAGSVPHPGFKFAFEKEAMFTLREWAVSEGQFEWSLPSEAELQAFKCFTYGSKLEDSRYRQVVFTAITPDCVETITRTNLVDDTITEP
jgi:hypothetical protein